MERILCRLSNWYSTGYFLEIILVGMGYVPGTKIDLSYINRKPVSGGDFAAPKSGGNLVDVGTQFIFRLVGDRLVAARRIPVCLA